MSTGSEKTWLAYRNPKTIFNWYQIEERSLRQYLIALCKYLMEKTGWWYLFREHSTINDLELYVDGRYPQGLQDLQWRALELSQDAKFNSILATACSSYLNNLRDFQTDAIDKEIQLSILRDIISPFTPVTIDKRWYTPTVRTLLKDIYYKREKTCTHCKGTGKDPNFDNVMDCAFCREGVMHTVRLDSERMALLSDALFDAGCENFDLICHLKGMVKDKKTLQYKEDPNCFHVRGCWAIETLRSIYREIINKKTEKDFEG